VANAADNTKAAPINLKLLIRILLSPVATDDAPSEG
jgi:hypothetical protein